MNKGRKALIIKYKREEIEDLNGDVQKNKIQIDCKKDLEKMEKKIKNNEMEISNLKKNIEDYKDELNKIKNDNLKLSQENENLKIIINEKKSLYTELLNSFENEKNKNLTFNSILNDKENKIKILENKIKLISEIINNKESNDQRFTKITFLNDYEEKKNNYYDENNNNYGKVGIKNEELNCYMSSIIQILKNIKIFSFKILETNEDDKIIESFQKLIKNLLYSKEKIVSLYEFKKNFSKVYTRFEGRKNNDSAFFMMYLFQYLNKKFNKSKVVNPDLSKYYYLELKSSEIEELKKFLDNYESRNNSFLQNLFFGYQMNKIDCTGCYYSQTNFQSFNILDLPIVDEYKKLRSLEECLNCYLITKDQKGIDGFECINCDKKLLSCTNCIIKLPTILIINLKRVGESKVYNHEVEIPFILKLKAIEKLNKFNKNYELIGFLKHYGNENRGHNVAYSKNIFDNKWYCYNDEKVEKINGYPSTEKSFLFFYQLLENESK